MIDSITEKDLDKLAELIKKHDLQEIIMRKGITTNNNSTVEYEFTLKAKDSDIIKEITEEL